MDVKIKITIDKDALKTLQDAIEPSLQQAAEAMKSQIVADQVVPKETGELERSAFVRKQKRSKYQIVYDVPKARRLYWHPEYNFRQDKNPNARGMWMQSYIDGDRKDYFKKAFSMFYKQNTRGVVK